MYKCYSCSSNEVQSYWTCTCTCINTFSIFNSNYKCWSHHHWHTFWSFYPSLYNCLFRYTVTTLICIEKDSVSRIIVIREYMVAYNSSQPVWLVNSSVYSCVSFPCVGKRLRYYDFFLFSNYQLTLILSDCVAVYR